MSSFETSRSDVLELAFSDNVRIVISRETKVHADEQAEGAPRRFQIVRGLFTWATLVYRDEIKGRPSPH